MRSQTTCAMPQGSLLSYHSFVRAPKAALWAHYAASVGLRCSAAGAPGGEAPLEAQLTAFLLVRMGPMGLSGGVWCAQWGFLLQS